MPATATNRFLPISDAARALDVSPATLRRMLAQGAPAARTGGKGRGRCTLVDPAAIAAWRRSPAASVEAAPSGPGIDRLAELVAKACARVFELTEGRPRRHEAAALLAAAGYAITAAIADELGHPEPNLHATLARLREIGRTA